MTITKETFKRYCKEVLGYTNSQYLDILASIREGTPMEEFLTQEELNEAYEFEKQYVYPYPKLDSDEQKGYESQLEHFAKAN